MNRFTKISATCELLPKEAGEWVAVLDDKQGLEWAKTHIRVRNYKEALAALNGFELLGKKDWRLPTVEESFLLADRSRHGPAIDTDFFPDCASAWYWTGSLYAPSPGDYACSVDFDDGYAGWFSQSGDGFVRAVRVGQ